MKTSNTWLAVALAFAIALPAAAQRGRSVHENGLRLFGGVYEPEGDSEYWEGIEEDFTTDSSEYRDFVGGIEYVRELSGNLRLMIGATAFESTDLQAYRDFEDADGDDILHDTTLSITSATIGLAVNLAPRHAPVVPYVGVGAGLYSWDLEERGDFIDFSGSRPEIFSDTFVEDGVETGWYWMAGLEVPVSSSFSIFAQGRWHEAKADLEDDFEDLGELDLGGRELTAGFTWRF